MERTLLVLRHAKSSWDDPSLADHERPLNPRGRDAVDRLRRHLDELALPVELVLCSSAVRTVQTLEGVRAALPGAASVQVEDALYGASAYDLLARLKQVPAELGMVLLVGHNPGVAQLVHGLTGGGSRAAIEKLERKYPTGGLARLRVAHPWEALAWGGCQLVSFEVPRELR